MKKNILLVICLVIIIISCKKFNSNPINLNLVLEEKNNKNISIKSANNRYVFYSSLYVCGDAAAYNRWPHNKNGRNQGWRCSNDITLPLSNKQEGWAIELIPENKQAWIDRKWPLHNDTISIARNVRGGFDPKIAQIWYLGYNSYETPRINIHKIYSENCDEYYAGVNGTAPSSFTLKIYRIIRSDSNYEKNFWSAIISTRYLDINGVYRYDDFTENFEANNENEAKLKAMKKVYDYYGKYPNRDIHYKNLVNYYRCY